MDDKEKLQLVSPCGYNCLGCAAYINSTCSDEVIIQKEADRANLTVEQLRGECSGCRAMQGRPHMNMLCVTYDCCVNKKGLDFCYQCDEFPCLKLAPISDRAEVRRHNTKVYNLLMLKKLGLDEYVRKSSDFVRNWAKGKHPVLGDDVQVP